MDISLVRLIARSLFQHTVGENFKRYPTHYRVLVILRLDSLSLLVCHIKRSYKRKSRILCISGHRFSTNQNIKISYNQATTNLAFYSNENLKISCQKYYNWLSIVCHPKYTETCFYMVITLKYKKNS